MGLLRSTGIPGGEIRKRPTHETRDNCRRLRNTTYSGFVGGTPPASKFKIAKGPSEGCPRSKNCRSAEWQAHRLHHGQHATHSMFA